MENFEFFTPLSSESPEQKAKSPESPVKDLSEEALEAEERLNLPGGFQADIKVPSGADENQIKEVDHSGAVLEKELDADRERLMEYISEINSIGKDFDSVYSYFDDPSGKYSMDEEIGRCLAEREAGKPYEPKFTFPKMEEIDWEALESKVDALEKVKDEISSEKNEDVREVAKEIISNYQAKMRILLALRKDDKEETEEDEEEKAAQKEAFDQSVIAYGDIDDRLIARAQEIYESRLNRDPDKKSDLQNKLEGMEFNASDLQDYFNIALRELGDDNPFEVVIDKGVKVCTVDFNKKKISIPPDREVNGKRLLELIAHEIGIHAMTNKRNDELFGGLGMGSEWETVQEGFAKLNEEAVKKEVFGADYEGSGTSPYYILAMSKARESLQKGEDVDILAVYDYIFNLKKKSIEIDEVSLIRYAKKKKIPLETAADHMADKDTKAILRRVFRGLYPYYF
ncbi:MAG: tyrosine/phenylalanine carboxypeptidase domain-containing protein [Patescibacteria group bacterium]